MRRDLRVIKQPWAWKLKDVCFQLYGHLGLKEGAFYDTPEGREFRNVKLPRINKTPVEIWIDMGTPAIRERVWDDTWLAYVKSIEADVVICPDTRFPNEIAICDYTVHVYNPRIPNREGKSVDDVLDGFTGWQNVIINDSGLSELRGQANTFGFDNFGPQPKPSPAPHPPVDHKVVPCEALDLRRQTIGNPTDTDRYSGAFLDDDPQLYKPGI